MDIEVDHYAVLALPSGEQGAKLSQNDICKAFRKKALELHPDKRPHDPNAHVNFQKLKTSYDILKDEKERKLYDDLLCVKRQNIQHLKPQKDSKRRKMMADLHARERAAASARYAREEEERRIAGKLKEEIAPIRAMYSKKVSRKIARKLKEEMAQIRAMHSKKVPTNSTNPSQKESVDKEKVYWRKIGESYTSQRLRELFNNLLI